MLHTSMIKYRCLVSTVSTQNYCFHVAARSTESGIMQPHRDRENDILCPSYRNTFEAAAPSWQRSGNVCFGFVTVLSPKSLPDLAILSAMRQNDVKQNAEITNIYIHIASAQMSLRSQLCKESGFHQGDSQRWAFGILQNELPVSWWFFAHEHHKSFSETT